MEVAVAMQRLPIPIGLSVVPAGWADITIARLSGCVFDKMGAGERGLGDPSYHGQADKIYAPPKMNMTDYVGELD